MITKDFFHHLTKTIDSVFWGLFLQGVTLLVLAILIFIFPDALTILAVLFFLWLAFISLFLAFKVWISKRKYHKYWEWLEKGKE